MVLAVPAGRRRQPGGAGQQVEQADVAIAGAGQQIHSRRTEAGAFQADLPQAVSQVEFNLRALQARQLATQGHARVECPVMLPA
jgi:hypothetical protein